ncbi:hypothetical protein D3218_02395 [Aureimonas flava]|uniref:Uncharacterized protein n=1 Tax=Aureimonas flava TaxID=2320271 RepID=A0A3A1WRE7_9HYPH|nr:hypothetical protein [Aureimonas flava]RIY03616.1 hypothetical protein D3218_02395 [Aureimonas flava]
MTRISSALLLGALLCSTPAHADPQFLSRFEGSFRGSGSVQREQDSSPRRVSCTVDGTLAGENRLRIAGTCRAAVIVRREIGADIRFDPGSGRFSGSYTGSTRGVSQLSNGRLRGDTLTFTLTYPVVVHGDRTAVMTIRNEGGGAFSLSVTDQVDGASRRTSDISLGRI